MATQLQLRRGTTSENASFTGAVGEVTVDTTKDTLIVQDGSTAGGHELAKADGTNISFGDNVKATFGAGDDLQIFHTGSYSAIKDVGTGALFIGGDNYVDIGNGNLSQTRARFYDNTVELRSGGSTKLATTPTGIDVTGTATMDGLTVDGSSKFSGSVDESSSGGLSLKLGLIDASISNSTDAFVGVHDTGGLGGLAGDLLLVPRSSTGVDNSIRLFSGQTTPKLRQNIAGNGDISFYEDTGTTPKFFWDASAESLGIGTTSPANTLTVGDLSASSDWADATVGIKCNANHKGIILQENSGAEQWEIGVGEAGSLKFYDSGSETPAVTFIDGGNVGIGTSSPARELHISKGGQNGVRLTSTTFGADFGLLSSVSGQNGFGIYDYNAAGYRFNIDSSGRVGIGRTPTSHILETAGEIKLASLGANQGIDAFNTSSVQWGIKSTSASAAGVAFEVGNTERMRIDSSGNLLVGTTSNAPTSGSGFSVQSIGRIFSSVNGGYVASLNRGTSDGEILRFRKDGTTVGSIGSQSDHVYISASGTTSAGLRLQNNSIISPTKNAVVSDNTIDLGQAGGRFKDLYLSGGVYLGGTGAANKLDDYEEGTWTPTAQLYSGTMTVNSATYTKIGNLVTLKASVTFDATTDNSAVSIQNVPFAHTGANKANGGYVTASTVATASKISGSGSGTFNLKDASGSAVTYTAIAGSTLDFVLIYETA